MARRGVRRLRAPTMTPPIRRWSDSTLAWRAFSMASALGCVRPKRARHQRWAAPVPRYRRGLSRKERIGLFPKRRRQCLLGQALMNAGLLPTGKSDGNGRGERTQADRIDLNVPLVLSCELVGAGRWSHASAG